MNEPQTGRGTLVVIGGYLVLLAVLLGVVSGVDAVFGADSVPGLVTRIGNGLLAIGATRLLAGVVRDWWRDRRRPR
ncbi:hypothetical protein [Actinoplanes palleronii]|uniref:Uncharacterized protein n=1 Tax=Actinoplanes palleronii TaxID=113570 RepID=A0ABQ4BDM9_9ACTN|nr:hypothetical protein [Actinoplanes palleronii]GIE68788.1 hypothetical protein Apa02nite_048960 [Actinoplanes palleronii]